MNTTSSSSSSGSEKSNKTQQGSESGERELTEGYYSMFHKAEEISYGPDSPLSSKDKVFRYLMHNELRWHQNHPSASPKTKDQIGEATGLTHSQIEKSIRVLSKSKFVETLQSKIGGVCQPTRYRINHKSFGNLWVPKEKGLSLIQGGLSDSPREGSSQKSQGVQPNRLGKQPLFPKKSSVCRPINKGFKQIENNTGKMGKSPVESKGIPFAKARAEVLSRYPSDGLRFDSAYRQISQEKRFKNTQVKSPAGFVMKGWEFIRDDYAFVDEIERQKNRSLKEEEPFDEIAAAKARSIAMNAFRNRSAGV